MNLESSLKSVLWEKHLRGIRPKPLRLPVTGHRLAVLRESAALFESQILACVCVLVNTP